MPNHPLDGEMLQGTLDLLILQTLAVGAAHGHTIAHVIERKSDEVLPSRAWIALSGAASSRKASITGSRWTDVSSSR